MSVKVQLGWAEGAWCGQMRVRNALDSGKPLLGSLSCQWEVNTVAGVLGWEGESGHFCILKRRSWTTALKKCLMFGKVKNGLLMIMSLAFCSISNSVNGHFTVLHTLCLFSSFFLISLRISLHDVTHSFLYIWQQTLESWILSSWNFFWSRRPFLKVFGL